MTEQRRSSATGQRKARRADRVEPFLNPYTFIPAFPRDRMAGAFADGVPAGADRLHPNDWTGTVGVRLTVRTPLLLLDTARAYEAPDADEGHLTYPVLLRNDHPHLPATALKGMLRASYEAVTNSRFGVFTGHGEPHGWRRVVDDAQDMRPVRVSEDGQRLEYWLPVRLPCYRGEPCPKYSPNRVPQHGDHVWVKTVRSKNVDRVSAIKLHEEPFPGAGWKEGYVFITEQNVENKRDERVFVRLSKPQTARLTKELRARWEALMDHHRKHQKDAKAGSDLQISPHRIEEERRTLAPGSFCWAYSKTGPIEALYPVMIPRELAAVAAVDMVPTDVEPAQRYRELSPADRVFGWAAPEGSGTRPAAHRGRLRISDVTCETPASEAVVRFPGNGLPLAILAQPKPAQGRFYLSGSASAPEEPISEGTPKRDVHRDRDRALRGRKVYWHHKLAAESDTYWAQPPAPTDDPTQRLIDGRLHREYRRPNKPSEESDLTRDRTRFATTAEPQRDKQNRSVLGWIGKGTEFTFTIGIRDLPAAELGALLWLLCLPEDHHHRLGLGKPLGFGSVHLALDLPRTKLHTGEQWSQYYRNLDGELPDTPAGNAAFDCIEAFVREARKQPGFEEIDRALSVVARGKDLPVHYPRARPPEMRGGRTPPNPAGESYAWFTANEKTSGRKIVDGRGRSLPSAAGTRGRDLDVYDREKD